MKRLYFIALILFVASSSSAQLTNCLPDSIFVAHSSMNTTDTIVFEYQQGRVITEATTSNGTKKYVYSPSGRLTHVYVVLRNGQETERCPVQYDSKGRVSQYIEPQVQYETNPEERDPEFRTREYLSYTPIELIYGEDGRMKYVVEYKLLQSDELIQWNWDKRFTRRVTEGVWSGDTLSGSLMYDWSEINLETPSPTIEGLVCTQTNSRGQSRYLQLHMKNLCIECSGMLVPEYVAFAKSDHFQHIVKYQCIRSVLEFARKLLSPTEQATLPSDAQFAQVYSQSTIVPLAEQINLPKTIVTLHQYPETYTSSIQIIWKCD